MEENRIIPPRTATLHPHPLLLVAAASITLLSLAGVGVLAGWLPGPGVHNVEPAKVAAAAPQTAAVAPISIQQNVTVPQEKAKPAAKTGEPAPTSYRRTARAAAPSSPALAVSPAPTYMGPTYVAAPLPPVCRDCGVVEAVREVAVEAKGSGGGAVTGGLLGGYIGNQWGRGATRDIATVLGAIGGAYAGNHIEKSVKESKRYDVIVRFEDGSTRTFSSDSPPAWHSGDRVKLQNGLLTTGTGSSVDNFRSI